VSSTEEFPLRLIGLLVAPFLKQKEAVMKLYATLLLTACFAAGCNKGYSETTTGTTQTTSAILDRQDMQDKSGVDQPVSRGSTQDDLDRTAEVKNALMTGGTLGADARNVDVTTHDGVITLRGQVTTEEEKAFAESTTMLAAGGYQVDNQLEVLSSNNSGEVPSYRTPAR
jgi:osmotically-inducible protein OsmY